MLCCNLGSNLFLKLLFLQAGIFVSFGVDYVIVGPSELGTHEGGSRMQPVPYLIAIVRVVLVQKSVGCIAINASCLIIWALQGMREFNLELVKPRFQTEPFASIWEVCT